MANSHIVGLSPVVDRTYVLKCEKLYRFNPHVRIQYNYRVTKNRPFWAATRFLFTIENKLL